MNVAVPALCALMALGPADAARPAPPPNATSAPAAPAAVASPDRPQFVCITEKAGITFTHSYGDRHLSNIVEATGPGCALFDYDGDGRLDIYLVNGCWLRDVNDNLGRDLRGKLCGALYRNRGDGTFEDVTARAGIRDTGYGIGASAADYDNDGDLDLYLLNFGPNKLLRNDGNGRFTDVSRESGLADPHFSVSASWFDYDGDGDLDVYVANYLEYDAGAFRTFYAASGFPGPLSYKAQPGALYRNNGDGAFTDVTKEAGVYRTDGRAMSAIACDLNGDGLLDLYVANDATNNWLFLGTPRKTFEEKAVEWNAAFGEGGQGVSSMGPAAGDIDNDGHTDLYIPDMGYGCLLLNRGAFFEDATTPSGLALTCGQYTGWGAVPIDYDNDGLLDLFIANGDAHHEYSEHAVLARNDGKAHFTDVSRESGAFFLEQQVARGAAAGDIDNDGDVDVLMMVLNGPPKLLRNDGGNRRHWLSIACRGPKGRVDVIGARVTVTVGDRVMTQQVIPGNGYLSQSDSRLHFGLGDAAQADRVEIRWPGGKVTTRTAVKANQFLEIRQDAK